LRQTLVLHVVGFDAVTITLLAQDVGQTHVFGISVSHRIAIRILFFGHGQAHVLFVWALNAVTRGIVGLYGTGAQQTQKDPAGEVFFHRNFL